MHAHQQNCASLGKMSCKFEVVRKACCMCDGGGLPMGEAYNFESIRNKTLVFIGCVNVTHCALPPTELTQPIEVVV